RPAPGTGAVDARRADFADLHRSGRHALDPLAAAAELLPADLVAGRFFEIFCLLRHAVRDDHVLVADGHFLRLRTRGRREQRKRHRGCKSGPKRFHAVLQQVDESTGREMCDSRVQRTACAGPPGKASLRTYSAIVVWSNITPLRPRCAAASKADFFMRRPGPGDKMGTAPPAAANSRDLR